MESGERLTHGSDDGMRPLRQRLAASVLERVAPQVSGVSAHFGEDYEFGDEPEAAAYRRTGGSFRFLAFAFSPWRMWDLHVGVVPTGDELSLGLHISERAAPILQGRLEQLAAELGVPVIHQPRAVEYQANLPPVGTAETDLETIAATIADLCGRLAPIARETVCPDGMRAS